MPKLEVSITDQQMKEIKDNVRSEIERSFNYDKMMEYIKGTTDIGFAEFIWKYGLLDRVEALKDMKVRDLSSNQKLMLATYWMMKEQLGYY